MTEPLAYLITGVPYAVRGFMEVDLGISRDDPRVKVITRREQLFGQKPRPTLLFMVARSHEAGDAAAIAKEMGCTFISSTELSGLLNATEPKGDSPRRKT